MRIILVVIAATLYLTACTTYNTTPAPTATTTTTYATHAVPAHTTSTVRSSSTSNN